ncbi:MAG: PPC domain-containing protein, partial [Sandaracinaceae bacterium]|nr:PPC domain-containing protein [Sandaracinaceae bacterium]
ITDGQICADDDDYFRIDGAFGDRVTVTLDGFTHAAGDLDLQLRSSTGTILASSATVRDMESASACIGEGADRVYARVFGFMGAQNAYALRVDREAGACCTDDGGEPDDTRSSARPLVGTDFDGTICPMDDDWIAVPVTGPSRIEATLIFTHAMGDLDLELYAPDGTLAGYSRGITDEESIGIDVGTAGTYALRVLGYGGAGNQYLGMVTLTARSGCTTSRDCPTDRVCSAGTCIPGACTGTCPAMHTCSTGGPPPAANWCAMACTVNADCRSTEACKWFPEGRGCGARGSAANGDACATLADCGGQRACLSWPRGYCARAGCTSNSDCESGTYCVAQGGLNVCAKSCVVEDCREADGYTCAFRPTLGGTDRFVCVPAS